MNETIRRAGRTFWQAAVGYIVANFAVIVAEGNWADVEWIKSTLLGLGVSAVAAGLAALMNMPVIEEDADENL